MSPVYSVTHVAGLDPPNPLPARGEREQRAARTTKMKKVRNIGMIGLGKMGMPMAHAPDDDN
jgi:hypothetical protein